MTDNLIEICVDSLAFGGAGVGRVDGKVIFASGTLPGDRALVRIERSKKKFAIATMSKLIEPSPLRREPPCPVAGICGGCPWMALDYKSQLEWKGRVVEDSLKRIGKIDEAEIVMAEPAPEELGYRSRIRMQVSQGSQPRLSFHQGASSELIPIDSCPVAAPAINKAMAELAALLLRETNNARSINEVIFETGDDGSVRVTTRMSRTVSESFGERILAECETISGVTMRRAKAILSYGATGLTTEPAPGVTLTLGPGSFSQINREQNRRMVQIVLGMAELGPGKSGLDLFCGVGNFTIPMALSGATMEGIDSSRSNVDDARRNAKRNSADGATFTGGDAGRSAAWQLKEGRTFDTLIVNPPRGGVEKIGDMAPLAKERIVYISCDPPALARDAARLDEAGFRLQRVEMIDMFPQTAHVELACLFERR